MLVKEMSVMGPKGKENHNIKNKCKYNQGFLRRFSDGPRKVKEAGKGPYAYQRQKENTSVMGISDDLKKGREQISVSPVYRVHIHADGSAVTDAVNAGQVVAVVVQAVRRVERVRLIYEQTCVQNENGRHPSANQPAPSNIRQPGKFPEDVFGKKNCAHHKEENHEGNKYGILPHNGILNIPPAFESFPVIPFLLKQTIKENKKAESC